jgi:hypothetical protein
MDPIVRAVVSRYQKSAMTKTLDIAWVTKMRADFLTLMRNLPRVQDFETGVRLREAFAIYRENFKKFIFDELLFKSKDLNLPISLEAARKIAWDFYLELSFPLENPRGDRPKDYVFDEFLRKKGAWEKRVKEKAQKCWKALKDSISIQSKPVSIDTPDEQRAVIEGFQTVLFGYTPGDEWQEEMLSLFKEVLRVYRRLASQRVPWMLKKQLPIEVDFVGCDLDDGAFYLKDRISVCMLTLSGNTVLEGVHALAHEMGHHLYKQLSSQATEFWHTAIVQDYGPLDLEALLKVWPENLQYYDQFVEYMAHKDPVLALQVDVVGMGAHDKGSGLDKREDFQEAFDSGRRSFSVPKHPITAYGGKNAEESFCEALGRLVAYGPSTVLEEVKHWLNIVIPGDIKMASKYQRWVAMVYSLF